MREYMPDYSVIGKRVPPIDGKAKVTGEAKFTVDLQFPGMLYGKILRSPFPHAKILRIDTEKARKLRGVKAVMTGENVPKVKFGVFTHLPQTLDQYGLAMGKARYIGEEVAAVAAVDEWIAEEALDLISVEYEELSAVFDPEEGMKPGAPLVHENVERNISRAPRFHYGDVDQGFQSAYYIREDKYVTQPVTHCAFEVHACIAHWDPTGKITLWSSTQGPFKIAEALSYVLGLPLNKIRVVKPFVGGGFGGKVDGIFPMDLCAILLSKRTGKPVKIVNTREEEFCATRRRHPFIIPLPQPFDRRDLLALRRDRQSEARKNGFLIHQHRACPAGPQPAYRLRPGQTQILPKDLEQRLLRLDQHLIAIPIHPQRHHLFQLPYLLLSRSALLKIEPNPVEMFFFSRN